MKQLNEQQMQTHVPIVAWLLIIYERHRPDGCPRHVRVDDGCRRFRARPGSADDPAFRRRILFLC